MCVAQYESIKENYRSRHNIEGNKKASLAVNTYTLDRTSNRKGRNIYIKKSLLTLVISSLM